MGFSAAAHKATAPRRSCPTLRDIKAVVFHLSRWGQQVSEHGIGAAIVAILLFLDSAPDKHGFVVIAISAFVV
jgi:hypothetical protein